MAECQLPKLNTGVRFPSPAPHSRALVRLGVLLYSDKKTRPDNRTDPFFDFFVLLHKKHTVVIELFARVLFELIEQILNSEL